MSPNDRQRLTPRTALVDFLDIVGERGFADEVRGAIGEPAPGDLHADEVRGLRSTLRTLGLADVVQSIALSAREVPTHAGEPAHIVLGRAGSRATLAIEHVDALPTRKGRRARVRLSIDGDAARVDVRLRAMPSRARRPGRQGRPKRHALARIIGWAIDRLYDAASRRPEAPRGMRHRVPPVGAPKQATRALALLLLLHGIDTLRVFDDGTS